ncbi:Major facilitator-type transporter ecdD [Hyphodiscus hymeniophilus]|uniref:Major facilitator-type transporter ecdD n=1 Tax=Hyphodiscus hymeniophilus TaxID=353542 RepID=A0A9P6VFP9_9HELO|nr:Major facilitator-type transporter ecdD [Hyphodiscus hymeniophilus]
MGLIPRRPADEPGSTWPVAFGFFVSIGGILFGEYRCSSIENRNTERKSDLPAIGYDTGTIAGILAMPFWKTEFATSGELEPSSSQTSLIVSILSAGTFVGALLSAPLADVLGRRWAIAVSCTIVFNLGVVLQTISTSQPLFIAGRFFAGAGVGLVSAQVPLYQSETMPRWIRGAVVGSYQLCINVGLFIAALIEYRTHSLNNTGSYRIPIGVQFLWSITLATGVIFFPETPRWLIKQDRYADAAKSLSRLRRLPPDHAAVIKELDEVKFSHEYEKTLGDSSYLTCFKGSIGKRLLMGCALQALQQLSGINFIFYYGTNYFKQAGFQNNPYAIQIILTAVSIVSILPGLLLIDKAGRRTILLIGSIGMTITQIIIATIGTVIIDPGMTSSNPNLAAQRANIAFVCFYVFFFEMSWGPCAWIVTGEMFPLKVRARCLSITTASNWLLNFVIAFVTPYMTDSQYGDLKSKVFYVWLVFCAIGIFFVYFCIYETKNLTLEQVDELFLNVNKAWKSKLFVPSADMSLDNVTDEMMLERSKGKLPAEVVQIEKK